MPIVVNSNTTATTASFNLSRANDALRKSLARLSSGNRIVSPADDAGGMAVAYKLNSKLKRTEAVRQNIQNGISYLQVQDGALSVIGKTLSRMAELRTMSMDVTKNSGDVENYSKEFVELQSQLGQIKNQKFNGQFIFNKRPDQSRLQTR
jgi:flagellin